MTYNDTLTAVLATTEHDALANLVYDTVVTLEQEQDPTLTKEAQNFMLHHNSTIELRIETILKHLGGKLEVQPDSKYDFTKGVICGYFGARSSSGGVAHLVMGVPGLCGILITVVKDGARNSTLIHKAVRTLIAGHVKSQVQHIGLSEVTATSRYPHIIELYTQMQTIADDGSIDERPVDPLDNPEYTEAVYQGYWHQGKTLKEIQEAYLAKDKPPVVEPTP